MERDDDLAMVSSILINMDEKHGGRNFVLILKMNWETEKIG